MAKASRRQETETTNTNVRTTNEIPSRVGEIPDPVIRQTTQPPQAIIPLPDVRTAAQCLEEVQTLWREYAARRCPKDRRRILERLIRFASDRYKQLERADLRIVR